MLVWREKPCAVKWSIFAAIMDAISMHGLMSLEVRIM